ncbi:hypothetical protein Tco_1083764 [Tanacetum coccineum]
MLVPQVVEDEASGQPSEPQPQSSTTPPSLEEQVTNVASLPQKTHTPRRAKRGQDTKIPQSNGPPKKVGDETVYTGEDDRVVRAATTAASLEAEQESEVNTFGSREDSLEHQDDLMNFVALTPYDSPLSGGHTPGSDVGRPNINELMTICTKLSNRVLALEHSKTAQDLVIKKLQKKVKRLEKIQRGRNLKTRPMFEEGDFDDIDDIVNEAMENVEGDTVNAVVNTATTGVSAASASVTTAGVSISTAEPRTPPATTTTFEEPIAQTLVKMRSQKAKEKGVAFRDVEEYGRSTTILPTIDPKDKGKGIMQEPKKPPKNPIKAQIQRDAETAQRLFEEEQTQFERDQRIARERAVEQEAKDDALIEQMEDVQARMDADVLLAERLQQEEREQFTIEEKSRMLVEMIAERKRFFAAQRAAEQRMDEQEKEELKLCLKIVQDEDRVINYETLVVKSLIVDGESQLLGSNLQEEDLSYWKITRAYGSSKFYKVFSMMHEEFNRHDLLDLHILVMKRFESLAPEGYDLILWGDLKAMIEPNKEDEVWRNQQEWSVISWKLYECCGVHTLLMDGTLVSINMLVEKKYPLTKEMLTRMLNSRLSIQKGSTSNLKTRPMFEEGDFDDDFDDINDMVNEAMKNVEGYTVNTATTRVSADNEDLTIAQTLVKMRSQKNKEKGKGVAFRAIQEESARTTRILLTIDPKDKGKGIMQEPEKPPKNPRKAQIQMDEKPAMRLHEEEKATLERMQRDRAAQEEASNDALIVEFDDVQARMDADALLVS